MRADRTGDAVATFILPRFDQQTGRDKRERVVTEVVHESSDPIPAGGDRARIRGFPYHPAVGGLDGAISGTNPGECDHGPGGSCWLCRDL